MDLGTRLFLFMTRANIVQRDTILRDTSVYDVYVFENHDEYVNYFNERVGKYVDEELIKKAIYVISKKGQIVAFKGLCEYIIAALNR